jgi:hypothetical protein
MCVLQTGLMVGLWVAAVAEARVTAAAVAACTRKLGKRPSTTSSSSSNNGSSSSSQVLRALVPM